MKKFISVFLVCLFVLLLAACQRTEQDSSVTDAAGSPVEQLEGDTTQKHKAGESVSTAYTQEYKFKCDICNGDCTYLPGRFICPQLAIDSPDAQAVNAEIYDEYQKYQALAREASEDDTGLAYAFTYNVYDDGEFAVIRTNIATAMQHSGEYTYTIYYFNLEHARAATCAEFCAHMGLSPADVASFARLELQKSDEDYSDIQIASVNTDAIAVFPEDTQTDNISYFIKVKTNMLRAELTMEASELTARRSEIASEEIAYNEEALSRAEAASARAEATTKDEVDDEGDEDDEYNEDDGFDNNDDYGYNYNGWR